MPTKVNDEVRTGYRQWAAFYERDTARQSSRRVGAFHEAMQRHRAPGTRLLDIGCGTGISSLCFADLGYRVTGCEPVAEMLTVAETKPGAERIRFVRADVRCLPELGEFDVVCAVHDPISHLLTDADLATALHRIAHALAPGGLALFDQASAMSYQQMLQGRAVVFEHGDQFVVNRARRRASQDGGMVVDLCWDRFHADPDGRWRRTTHRIPFRYRPESLIRSLLAEAGLQLCAVHGIRGEQLTEQGQDQHDHALLYTARRPAD